MSHTSRTLAFAQHVASDALGIDLAKVESVCNCYAEGTTLPTNVDLSGLTGLDIMSLIEAIMAMVMDLLNNCPQRAQRRGLVQAIQRPSLFQKAVARRTLSNACRDCSNLASTRGNIAGVADSIFIQAKYLTEEDIGTIIQEVMED